MSRALLFSAIAVLFGYFWLRNPEELEFALVDVPDTLALAFAAWMVVYFSLVGIRAAAGLVWGAAAVVLAPSGVLDLTSPLTLVRSRSYAQWGEIVAVRVWKPKLFRLPMAGLLVLELSNRRPLRIALSWLTKADAGLLRDEVAARLGRPMRIADDPT